MHFCNVDLARQVPMEILTEILFLDITYTALNMLCKWFKTNQSDILSINSYALSDTLILANELNKGSQVWIPPQLYTETFGTAFVYWNAISLDQKKKGEAALRSQPVAVTKRTLLQADVHTRKKICQILTVCFFSPTYSNPVCYPIPSTTKQQLLQHVYKNTGVKF